MSRQATVVVADDALYSLSGKLNLSGVYGTDISIPFDPTHAAQLIFCFIIEAEPDDPYQQIVVRVELPGGDSRQMQLAMHTFVSGEADRDSVVRKVSAFVPSPRVETGPYTSKRSSRKRNYNYGRTVYCSTTGCEDTPISGTSGEIRKLIILAPRLCCFASAVIAPFMSARPSSLALTGPGPCPVPRASIAPFLSTHRPSRTP